MILFDLILLHFCHYPDIIKIVPYDSALHCNKEVTSFIMFENLLPWLGSAFIVALAASLQGITGFGFALVSMPLLLLIYDPHHFLPLPLKYANRFWSLWSKTYFWEASWGFP